MPTAFRSNFGASLTGTAKWNDGAVGTDGKLYFPPESAGDILVIDPVAETAVRTTMGLSLNSAWCGAAAADNGKIYAAPNGALDILIIDPAAGTASRSTMGASFSTTPSWRGLIKAPNGNLYGIPYNSANILIINPTAGTASRLTLGASLSGTNKWWGGVLAPNGKIYAIPYNSPDVLIINPAAGTAVRSSMGLSIPSFGSKWRGGALGADGKIYCFPDWRSDFLIIDPATDTAEISTMGATISGQSLWSGGFSGTDGIIYGIPYDAQEIVQIDPFQGLAIKTNMGISLAGSFKWNGGVLAPNGKFYCGPADAQDVLVIEPDPPAASFSSSIEVTAPGAFPWFEMGHFVSWPVQILPSVPSPSVLFRAFSDWSEMATETRKTPIYVLVLEKEGEEDIRIPISGFQSRLRAGEQSYLQVEIPNADAWFDEILRREGGRMVLLGGARIEGEGLEALEEIVRADIGILTEHPAAQSRTISLAGYGSIQPPAQRQRLLKDVSYRADDTGKRRYRCKADAFLRPGDTAIIPLFDEQVQVEMITYVVDVDQTTMEITGS